MNNPTTTELASKRLRRFSGIEFLVVLTLFFVSLPFIEALRTGAFIESILLTIVLISAVVAIAERRRVFVTAAVLAFPTLLARWIHHYRPDLLQPEVFLVGGILFVLFVIGNLLRFVLTAPSVNIEVLCASVSAYLLMGLLWAFGYWLIAELIPNAFAFSSTADPSIKGSNGLYFSFITLNTVGYGDIVPVAKVARMLAVMEATTGVLYVAVLIARLVSMYAAPEPGKN